MRCFAVCVSWLTSLTSLTFLTVGGCSSAIEQSADDGGAPPPSRDAPVHADGSTAHPDAPATHRDAPIAAVDAPAMASSDLTFAIVGDTRPPSIDDTSSYPSTIISKIYADIEAESPRPAFAIATGDYQYASTTGSEQQPQIDKYMAARAAFSGPLYPAMGNHECTGYTDSNCGTGNTDGVTANMTVFINTMLAPIGEAEPYYVENVKASDDSWTAKFVVVACNAWTTTQEDWLKTQLAVSTTYTFVVRHESAADMSGTKCSASQTVIDAHPLTLLIVGHTHEYSHEASDKEIINGIGGAPLTSGTNYGYSIVNRNSTGTLTVTTYDYSSHSVIDTFTIKADGTAG